MTREEKQKAIDAVERLNALKQFIGYDKDSDIVQATQKSLDMAIKALEQEPCEDAISRADVKKYLSAPNEKGDRVIYESDLDLLPPVTPQPKTGHWIWEIDETPSSYTSPYELNYAGWVCSCCREFPDDVCDWDNPDEKPTYKYCHNCGAKMESEDKE